MTTDQMPAAPAEQARELLDTAQNADVRPSACNATSLSYADAFDALRDATVGNGLALLAVRDELADIAASLRLLAKTPAAIDHLGDHVAASGQAVQDRLADVGNELFDLRSGLEKAGEPVELAVRSVVVGVHELVDAVDRLAEPRPRWWQWHGRRGLGQVVEEEAPR